MKNVVKLFKSEEGQGMVEYGLIIALVAVVAIVGLILLGPKIRDMFTTIAGQLNPSAS
jgi:pilus assembly protein Flp/PilA